MIKKINCGRWFIPKEILNVERGGLIHFTAVVFFDLFVIFYTTASNLIVSGPRMTKRMG